MKRSLVTDYSQLRRGGAYRIRDAVIVHPTAFTIDGIGISVTPVYRFTKDAASAEIGGAARNVLSFPPSIVPPRYWKEQAALGKEFLKAAGVSSWRKLQLDAVSCWMAANDGLVVFTPLRNGGTRGDKKGFQPFGASDIVVAASATDEALGAALIDALGKSE